MNECKEHRYRVEGETTETGCPYCEIDRLKAELEFYQKQEMKAHKDCDDLERQLDASRALLAEARAEVDVLKDELFCKDAVTLIEDCERFATENFKLKAVLKQARQETAMECLKMVAFAINDNPIVKGGVLAAWLDRNIKVKFGLEG